MKDEKIEFKKAIFTSNQIIIKKRKQDIIIPLKMIDRLLYAKFTIRTYLILGLGDYRSPGVLYIYLKEKINKRKRYCFFIKYENLTKIPEKIYQKIAFYPEW